MPLYWVTISAPRRAAVTDLIRKHGIEILDHGSRPRFDARFSVDAIIQLQHASGLRDFGYDIVIHGDVDVLGKGRQREVGRGNRYVPPRPQAPATAYLNVKEVEAALFAAASPPYSEIAQLITLPERTWEGRQCHAIKLSNGNGSNRMGVYFLGGLHSCEWGSSDILVHFVEQLQQAYIHHSGIVLGGKHFSARDIRNIVDKLDIIVFPQANPDGREWSMTTDAFWRKNRRFQFPNSAECPGVDLNRNLDFLWEYKKFFSSQSIPLISNDPCSKYFRGASAFSEPECLNVKWILDKYRNISYFVDLHSYGKQILYGWGDDEPQITHPGMNFRNSQYDGDRGVAGDKYKEFIPPSDLVTAKSLARSMRASIGLVRGTAYATRSEFSVYPTAGTSADYCYSRHFIDPTNTKTMSFTIEWGDSFHPPFSEMRHVIQEITAGLLAFCIKVQKGGRRVPRKARRSSGAVAVADR